MTSLISQFSKVSQKTSNSWPRRACYGFFASSNWLFVSAVYISWGSTSQNIRTGFQRQQYVVQTLQGYVEIMLPIMYTRLGHSRDARSDLARPCLLSGNHYAVAIVMCQRRESRVWISNSAQVILLMWLLIHALDTSFWHTFLNVNSFKTMSSIEV